MIISFPELRQVSDYDCDTISFAVMPAFAHLGLFTWTRLLVAAFYVLVCIAISGPKLPLSAALRALR
jgi:hypothetical protein